jgi:protocatechuate 3,4-dioxygenase beta subunit
VWFHNNIPRDFDRGKLRTDDAGRYQVRTTVPVAYQIPRKGPVGAMLEAMDRHSWRPAHVHFKVRADDLCSRHSITLIVGQKHLRRWGPLTRIHVKRAAERLLLAAEGGIEAWRIDTHRRDQLADGCAHTQVYADGRSSLTQCFSASESGSGGFIPWMVQKSIGVWSMWTSQR